jgi:hypothetical protein
LKTLATLNIWIDIPELRESNQNDDGEYIDNDGEILPWYNNP